MKNKAQINFEKGREWSLKAHDYPGGKITQKHWDKCKKKAVKYYRLAAYRGHPDAQCSLGSSYEEEGVLKTNYKMALYWILKAAKQDHPMACYVLGVYYEDGEKVKKNIKLSRKWIKKAADLGDPIAKRNL
jgi:TPR repeat protein